MTHALQGRNILFYGLIREGGFADAIARHARDQGAQIYCLAAPELTEEREAELAKQGIGIIRTALWYGLREDQYPEDFARLRKPEELLNWQPDPGALDAAFAESREDSLACAREIFRELDERTQGSIDAIVHIMAGGIPRTRGMMLLTKGMLGTDDPKRFVPTADFTHSALFRQLVGPNIDIVTAESFEHIFQAGADLLERNPQCRISALGYCGEHILAQDGSYHFSSYPGYLVGYAKNHLLEISQQARQRGNHSTIVNLMGAETASTNAFFGIEYYILNSLRQLSQSQIDTSELMAQANQLLNEDASVEQVLETADEYLFHPEVLRAQQTGQFPQPCTLRLAEINFGTSRKLADLHRDRRALISSPISEFSKQLMATHFLDVAAESRESSQMLDVRRIIERQSAAPA